MANPIQATFGVPDPQNELVNLERAVNPVWFKFFVGLSRAVSGVGNPVPMAWDTSGGSPFIGTATEAGLLLVSGGTLEFSRDNGNSWYGAGTGPANVKLRPADSFRVTWTGASPQVTFFKDL